MNKLNNRIFVDLDGTLISTDILIESFLSLIGKNIFYIFVVPFWLIRGKANLKHQIACRSEIRVDLLPYNMEFFSYLEKQKELGYELVLISASNIKFVEQVASHLKIFQQAIGSSENENLAGLNKLNRVREICGEEDFQYAGNDRPDLVLWRESSDAILVNASKSLTQAAEKITNIDKQFHNRPNQLKSILKSLRLHQWAKNVLIFLPLILSHQLTDMNLLLICVYSFFAFGMCASSVYLINDLLDLEVDRTHEEKRKRPFASGDLPLGAGLIGSPLLLFVSMLIASQLPILFLIALSGYFLLTLVYSTLLKAILIVDVLTLAFLYTFRIIAGAAVIGVMPTFWLLAFSVFFFFSLAIIKRVAELEKLSKTHEAEAKGRGYVTEDLAILSMLGTSSGFIAVLVFALYINDPETRELYATPELLWFICPLLLYVISRIWVIAYRGKLHHDPVVFVIRDSRSQLVAVLCGLLLFLSTISWV